MNLKNIISIGKNEYFVKEKTDLCNLSRFAYIGSKAFCKEDQKIYIQQKINKWVDLSSSYIENDEKPDEDEPLNPPTPTWNPYLTFSSDAPFTLGSANGLYNDGILEYSLDTETWTQWDGSNIQGTENVIYLRGSGNTIFTNVATAQGTTITFTQKDNSDGIQCSGNIETLLDYEAVEQGIHPQMGFGCFGTMFENNTLLKTAPELPSMNLTEGCYMRMFSGCTNLLEAPQLPATTLASACYNSMFQGCTSLTSAPELPALEIPNAFVMQGMEIGTYAFMFQNCTSLVFTPVLPATSIGRYGYASMFMGCTSLTIAPELPATTLAEACYYEMFWGCTSIRLSETQISLFTESYRIPSSGTGVDATDALDGMFAFTGGTFTGTPNINTTYYMAISNEYV